MRSDSRRPGSASRKSRSIVLDASGVAMKCECVSASGLLVVYADGAREAEARVRPGVDCDAMSRTLVEECKALASGAQRQGAEVRVGGSKDVAPVSAQTVSFDAGGVAVKFECIPEKALFVAYSNGVKMRSEEIPPWADCEVFMDIQKIWESKQTGFTHSSVQLECTGDKPGYGVFCDGALHHLKDLGPKEDCGAVLRKWRRWTRRNWRVAGDGSIVDFGDIDPCVVNSLNKIDCVEHPTCCDQLPVTKGPALFPAMWTTSSATTSPKMSAPPTRYKSAEGHAPTTMSTTMLAVASSTRPPTTQAASKGGVQRKSTSTAVTATVESMPPVRRKGRIVVAKLGPPTIRTASFNASGITVKFKCIPARRRFIVYHDGVQVKGERVPAWASCRLFMDVHRIWETQNIGLTGHSMTLKCAPGRREYSVYWEAAFHHRTKMRDDLTCGKVLRTWARWKRRDWMLDEDGVFIDFGDVDPCGMEANGGEPDCLRHPTCCSTTRSEGSTRKAPTKRRRTNGQRKRRQQRRAKGGPNGVPQLRADGSGPRFRARSRSPPTRRNDTKKAGLAATLMTSAFHARGVAMKFRCFARRGLLVAYQNGVRVKSDVIPPWADCRVFMDIQRIWQSRSRGFTSSSVTLECAPDKTRYLVYMHGVLHHSTKMPRGGTCGTVLHRWMRWTRNDWMVDEDGVFIDFGDTDPCGAEGNHGEADCEKHPTCCDDAESATHAWNTAGTERGRRRQKPQAEKSRGRLHAKAKSMKVALPTTQTFAFNDNGVETKFECCPESQIFHAYHDSVKSEFEVILPTWADCKLFMDLQRIYESTERSFAKSSVTIDCAPAKLQYNMYIDGALHHSTEMALDESCESVMQKWTQWNRRDWMVDDDGLFVDMGDSDPCEEDGELDCSIHPECCDSMLLAEAPLESSNGTTLTSTFDANGVIVVFECMPEDEILHVRRDGVRVRDHTLPPWVDCKLFMDMQRIWETQRTGFTKSSVTLECSADKPEYLVYRNGVIHHTTDISPEEGCEVVLYRWAQWARREWMVDEDGVFVDFGDTDPCGTAENHGEPDCVRHPTCCDI